MMTPQPLAVQIAGIGHYLPARRVGNAELAARLGVSADWIARATGVHERRYVTTETSAGMAAAAAQQALAMAGATPADLDLIVGASAAPQQALPCTAVLVQRELAAPDGRSMCYDVNATCVSFVLALHQAALAIATGTAHTALVFSSEIASLSLNPAEPESAVLFGDGAAAVVLRPTPPGSTSRLWHARFATHSSGAHLTSVLGGGTLHHPNDPATTPDMHLFHMQGPALFKRTLRLLHPFVDEFLATVGWQRSTVDVLVPHQASGHGLAYLSKRMGFRPAQVVNHLAQRGNTVAAALPLAFSEAVAQGQVQRGQRVMLLGTGAGIALAAAALTF